VHSLTVSSFYGHAPGGPGASPVVANLPASFPPVTALRDPQRLSRMIERAALRALATVGSSAGAEPSANTEPPPEALPAAERDPRAEHEAPVEPDLEPGAPARFAREGGLGWLAAEKFVASARLYARLDERDVAKIEELIGGSPELARIYAEIPDPGTRHQMVMAFGIWLGHPSVTEKTGLPDQQPPEDVHAMVRGPSAAAGGVYEADLVANALAGVGVDIADLQAALDFGCSSGRVVRVLRAAYPQTRWYGCDPNARAIAWAGGHLQGIEFFVNDDAPPLPLAEGSLDLAYAISIWSHFSPELGLAWFEEMHRLIRPGGHVVCTTHGFTSVAFYAERCLRTPRQSDEIVGALYRRGWWYAPEFGEEGDWGVVNPDWGTAFLSPEWLLTQLCPRWRVLEFAPGRNQDNQDVYVFQRA
jgi:SAM-dependent methyltransferase